MDGTKIAPPRTVGFWGTALFPLNGMIGAGIFALPAVLVTAVGNFAPWMMLIGGILFLPLALCYAWMSARFEHSGGSVLYGEAAFGRFVGFQAGWARYASAIVTAAANMHVMVAYLAALFPALEGPVAAPLAVAVGLALITVINLYGMRASVGTLGLMTAIKLVPLAALVVSGLFAGGELGAVVVPEFSQVETVILLTFYAFIGFEGVIEAAGEFKDPRRDVPRAIVWMVIAVTLIYMAVIWAFILIGPEFAGENNALAGSAEAAMGPLGSLAIVVAASFSIGANNFASGVAQPRLMYGMAERGMLPRWFEYVHPRFLTPSNAILFYGVAAILFGLWEGFEALAVAGTLIRLVTYIVTSCALPVLERREGRIVPLHLFCVIVAVASSLFIASQTKVEAWIVLGGILLVGSMLYALAARQKPEYPIKEA
ncbi:APC family permease [Qipengyuania sp. 6B39]|uniref:APC family permease n=1 Tax=Qipengyuania proteolytica TaxID=2867239 RepID=UPI001C8954E2|nr:APC family permease [Qipengyuania proteolytica]MBX7495548.1 APC family permease [Qipengyuania proteolytica]